MASLVALAVFVAHPLLLAPPLASLSLVVHLLMISHPRQWCSLFPFLCMCLSSCLFPLPCFNRFAVHYLSHGHFVFSRPLSPILSFSLSLPAAVPYMVVFPQHFPGLSHCACSRFLRPTPDFFTSFHVAGIAHNTAIRAFKRCRVSNALDGTDADDMWQHDSVTGHSECEWTRTRKCQNLFFFSSKLVSFNREVVLDLGNLGNLS